MLAVINMGLGANTQPQNKTINFMRAVKAIATANAGSTPTCNVISNPAGTFEANQMITVLANTEAGGWSVDTSNGDIGDTYSDSRSTPYNLHLYTDSGKNQYPYHCFTIRTNPNYSFNNSFSSYPHMAFYHGVSNTTVFGTGSYNGNYASGVGTSSYLLNDCNQQWSNFDYTGSYAATMPFNVQTTNYWQTSTAAPTYLGESADLYYVAATSDYIIIIHRGHGMIYGGERTSQGWEDTYDDNPTVCGFSFTGHPRRFGGSVCGWARTINVSGTVYSANLAFSKQVSSGSHSTTWSNNSYHSTEPVTGVPMYGGNQSYTIYWNTSYANRVKYSNWVTANPSGYYNMPSPLFYSITHSVESIAGLVTGNQYSSYPPMLYSPAVDTTTGSFTPPAVPIVFQIYGQTFNPGGRLKGIYKALSGPTSYCSSIASNRQSITVVENGANTTYMNINLHPWVNNYGNTYTDAFLIKAV